jgi:hypothetical protein
MIDTLTKIVIWTEAKVARGYRVMDLHPMAIREFGITTAQADELFDCLTAQDVRERAEFIAGQAL